MFIFTLSIFSTGMVKIWDPRQREVPVAVMKPREGESARDCWTVAFGKALHIFPQTIFKKNDNNKATYFMV